MVQTEGPLWPLTHSRTPQLPHLSQGLQSLPFKLLGQGQACVRCGRSVGLNQALDEPRVLVPILSPPPGGLSSFPKEPQASEDRAEAHTSHESLKPVWSSNSPKGEVPRCDPAA